MKLLFVYRFCGLGGVETAILNKLNALRTAGVEGRALFAEFYGSGGYTLAADPRITVGFTPDQLRIMLRQGFDALSVTDYPDFIDLLEMSGTSARVVFDTAASLPTALPRLHARLSHPLISAITVPSHFNKALVESVVGTDKPVLVIPNPIDVDWFSLRTETDLADVAPALTVERPIILWIGRLEDEKNAQEFMQVATVLLDDGMDARFVLVGDAYSLLEYEAYREKLILMVEPRWRDRFHFLQSVPYHTMPALYSLVAHSRGCLVSTSRFESAPMIFIEAMATGCPVVASRVGGVSEIVQDGLTGHTYTLGDTSHAVFLIKHVVNDRSHTASITTCARSTIERRNGFPSVAAAYQSLMESLVASDTAARYAVPMSSGDASGGSNVVPGLVSTIIPVYNRAHLLRQAVESVLAQTYQNIEIIIVDDGSTDGTGEVCEELARMYPMVRVIHSPHQGRAGLVREVGRRVARGEYIQYLDSDDLISPRKFEAMVTALEHHPECDIAYCFTRRYRVGQAPVETPVQLTGLTFATMFPDFASRRFWYTSTPLYRRKLCDKAGPWSDLPFWEDIEYDMRLASHAPRLLHCKEWLTDIRDHDMDRLSGTSVLVDPQRLGEAVRASVMIYGHIKATGLTNADRHVRSFIDDVRLLYGRCGALGLSHAAEESAQVVMDATGCERDDVEDYRVAAFVDVESSVFKARPGESVRCVALVENTSTIAFHGGEFATEVSYHLFAADGSTVRYENPERVVFDEPLSPGESRAVDVWIRAPDACGLFYVQIDLLWAGFRWLGSGSSNAPFLKLLVTERTAYRGWRLAVAPGNDAHLESQRLIPDAARVKVGSANTTTPWHIQLNYEGLTVSQGERYALSFQARSDRPRRLVAAVSRGHSPWTGLGLYREIEIAEEWQTFTLAFVAAESDSVVRAHFDAGGSDTSFEVRGFAMRSEANGAPAVSLPFDRSGRLQMDVGLRPASYEWGTDRGLPVHRYYLELFLSAYASDIRGHCLEFQNPQYAGRFGGAAIETLDIIHLDHSNPLATIVADLTQPNGLASEQFDCIVCTHVLHVILEVDKAIAELYRLLKPGGVLLVAVPHFSMFSRAYDEVWRFTPLGLERLLSRPFGAGNVCVRAYGNSLTAAGELRGVVADEFTRDELDSVDECFPVEVCARASRPR